MMKRLDEKLEFRDIEYGMDNDRYGGLTLNDIDIKLEDTDEKLDEVKTSIKEEAQSFEADMIINIENTEFLSKKEKITFKRIVSKRINQAIKSYSKEAEQSADGKGTYLLEDIGTELDLDLDKIKESVNEMLDIDDYNYGYAMNDNLNQFNGHWPKSTNYTPAKKDYSAKMEEIDSDRKIKIKIDNESLNGFLSESDGDNENIGIITAPNREFSDIEDVIFKIIKVENDIKKRQEAYTEADGKAISDYAQTNGLVKCGWIHTHPFTKNAIHFSGLDNKTTKEMCVLPDDYCLAIVVGCEYKEVDNYMKDDGKVVKEFDLQYNLGRITYRKVQLAKEKYIGKTDSIRNDHGFVMVKYECEIVTVDKDGNNIEEL